MDIPRMDQNRCHGKEVMGHTMWLEPLIVMGVIKPVNDLIIW